MAESVLPATYNVHIGNVSGQVAVGSNILQIGHISGGEVNIAIPHTVRPPTRRPTPRFLRPRPFPGLLGRTSEIGAASSALLESVPVELTGEAGIGKTSLLRYLAHNLSASPFPDGVVYLSARAQLLVDVLQCLFEAFYECEHPYKPTDAELRHLFKDTHALVLFDDIDLPHDQLEGLLDTAPGCAFLFADEGRSLYGEVQALALEGLPLEQALHLIERELGHPLTDAEREAATALCTDLVGHPLRLLQAAALSRAEGRPLTEAPTHATLKNRERRVLGALAFVAAPLQADEIAAIADIPDTGPALDILKERKLVRAEAGRYVLMAPLQTVALPPAESEALLDRAVAHFTGAKATTGIDPREIAGSAEAMIRVLDATAEQERWPDVMRLARRAEGALALAPRWGAWGRVLAMALEAARALKDPDAQAWALHQSGTRALCLGEVEAARTLLSDALEIRSSLGDKVGAELTRHNLNLLLPSPPSNGSGSESSPIDLGSSLWKFGLPALGLVAAATLGVWKFLSREHTPATSPTVPEALTFESRAAGSVSPMKPLAFFNRGSRALDPLRVEIHGAQAGDFKLSVENCSQAILNPEERCSIGVQFTPVDTGPRSATLSILGQAGQELGSVALSGSATPAHVQAPPPLPEPAWSPAALTFAAESIGAARTSTVTLSNQGTAQFQVRELLVEGRHAAEFTVRGDDCSGQVLPPAGHCRIQVSFAPVAAGKRTGQLVVRGDSLSASASLTGTGLAAPLPTAIARLEPDRLDFGTQQVASQSASRAVTVTNSGTAPFQAREVLVEGPHAAEFMVRGDNCSGHVLPPAGQCRIEVSFAPAAAGEQTGRLVLRGGSQSVSASLTGTGLAAPTPMAIAQLEPDRLDFGTQPVKSQSAPRRVTVTNAGTGPLSITAATLEGDDHTSFAAQQACSAPLQPTEQCFINVWFNPRREGDHTAALVLDVASGKPPPKTPLSGSGSAPLGPRAELDPTTLDFGTEDLQHTSEPRVVRITNAGSAELKVGRISVADGDPGGRDRHNFNVRSKCSGTTIPPGGSCDLSVRFTPRTLGPHDATLTVVNNASDGPHHVSLTGNSEGALLVVSPTALDFGQVPAGGSSERQNITLTNTGTKPFALGQITLGRGGVAGVFGLGDTGHFKVISNGCGSGLEPNESCTVGLIFTPQKAGKVSGKLNVFARSNPLPVIQADLDGTGALADTVEPQPPPVAPVGIAAPRPYGPGTSNPNSPPSGCGGTTVLSWAAVAGNRVRYLVSLDQGQYSRAANRWTSKRILLADSPSAENRRDVTTLMNLGEGSWVFRWSVKARDAAGNESRPSQAFYFTCQIIG